jgi:tetratricopeptide (TPR) repeat protein
MDLDGPQNDKGLYTLVPVRPAMTIRNEDTVSWTSFRGEFGSQLREGFMSQVSPDGRYVVTTIKPPGTPGTQFYYVANFTDYRFLQVFYPTRGILVWYDRVTKKLQPLPGANDPRYVQSSAVWSPDGKYLVFARALAKDPYPEGGTLATYANDPKEVPIQYDLCRIPFNEGKGGKAEPIAGASQNGMSNSFAKISPDGKWIVFVQARNGQLMRPDGRLYIVPAAGGAARRMTCNTDLMNSWHSFSPNGRWMVFSSKSRSPYTQMFLTHVDDQGNDTPAILIENSTAANRAVNIPEFVNIPPDGMKKIDAPATDFYRQFDVAAALARSHQYDAAIPEWKKALAMSPDDARAHNNFGLSLAGAGQGEAALAEYRKALELKPDYPEAHNNLAIALVVGGKLDEAIPHFQAALAGNPASAEAHCNYGRVLAEKGHLPEARRELETALALKPAYPEAHNNLAIVLTGGGRLDDAIAHYGEALKGDPEYADAHNNLGTALARKGSMDEAITHFRKAVELHPDFAGAHGNLGRALLAKQRFAESAPQFEKALQLGPELPDLHNNLGTALAAQGHLDEAIRHFERAAELDPASVEAQANLGRAFAAQQRFDQAIPRLEKAVALAPRSADLESALGYALGRQNRVPEAIPHFQKAVELNPNLPEAHYYLGAAMMMQRRPADALAQWRAVLQSDPDHVAALNEAAWILATAAQDNLRNGAEALRLATHAVELTRGEDPAILSTQAAAYAEAGRFEQAIEIQKRAGSRAPQSEAFKARLREFEAHRPLRTPR